MSAESRAAALRALERASVKRPDASLISGCCQFYVQKKAEGLKLNSTVYTFLSPEPNLGTGF